MMQKSIYKQSVIITLMLIVAQQWVHAQTISGVVKDAETQQPLDYCNILILKSTIGTTTDATGKFKITLPQNVTTSKLVISFLGYVSDTIQVSILKNNYEILLKPKQGTLNEVVVTGVSKAVLARENPIAIVSVSTKAIENTTETNIIDVLVKNVAGLNAVKTGPNISKPFIRGLGYNRVLTLYNGIRQEGQQWGDEHGIEVDAYNIGKAEVVKGPASIMYGSDAVAGVVSLIPEMPAKDDAKLKGKYFTEYQSNNGLIGNGLRLTFSKNNWAYALRGSYRIAKNYANNIDGRVYNTGFHETNASATMLHYSSKGYSNLNLTLYDNLQGIPDGSRDSITRQFTKQIYEGNNDDIKDRPVVSDAELNSYQLSPLHQRIQHYRIYSNNHYDIGKGDIDFSLAFQQNIRGEYNHPTIPQQAGMYVRLNTFNYDFRYNAPTVFNLEISIGVNGMYQDNKSKDATDFPIPDYDLFDIGSYVYAKWKQDKWTISGGLRYDNRHLQGNSFYTKINSITGFGKRVSPPDTAGTYLQFPAFTKTFNGTSLSIGTTYKLNEHINLKANMAKGYRAPSITEFASNGLDPGAHIIYLGDRNFVPEFSLQEDIGADIHFNNVSASASLFNNNIDHYIYLSLLTDANGDAILDAQGNKAFQYQQASAQLYGTELMLNIHPTILKGFSFDNSSSVVYGFNKKRAYKNERINGEYLPLIPPLKILSSINQNIKTKSKIFEEINGKIEAEFSAAQNRYLALNNTETATPSYTLFNVSINTKIRFSKSNALQFQFQVNNLFDKAYQSNLSRLKYFEYYTHSTSGHFGMYNMGRNMCIKTIVPFN
jgi:iron complex outermembrane receptor protein